MGGKEKKWIFGRENGVKTTKKWVKTKKKRIFGSENGVKKKKRGLGRENGVKNIKNGFLGVKIG